MCHARLFEERRLCDTVPEWGASVGRGSEAAAIRATDLGFGCHGVPDGSPYDPSRAMFLLVTGASGAGKSTVRREVAPRLSPEVECIELCDVAAVPVVPDKVWRQRATEAVVQRALELQAHGRHLLLSGDPVAPGEVLAAPSSVGLDGVAVCLLDVSPDVQAARLAHRGDDPSLLPHHQAFAEWMRGHARDPRHMPHVLNTNGWEAMRWDRWSEIDPIDGNWGMEVLDTSRLTSVQVADEILTWCGGVLCGNATILHPAGGQKRSDVPHPLTRRRRS